MKKYYYIYLLSVAAALCACDRRELEPVRAGQNDEVDLLCAVSRPSVRLSTKADLENCFDYSGALESTTVIPEGKNLRVGLVRVDRLRSNFLKYADRPDHGLVMKASMKGMENFTTEELGTYDYTEAPHYYFTDGELEGDHDAGYRKIKNFYHAQYYKTNSDVVEYVCWYPFGTPNGNAASDSEEPFKVSQTLDLKTDVMLSNIASESMNREYKDTVVFKHGLCQFRIHVYRMINNVQQTDGSFVDVNVWGKLSDLKVKHECTHMDLVLPSTFDYDYTNGVQDFWLKSQLPNAVIQDGVLTFPAEQFPNGNTGVYFVADETLSGSDDPVEGVPFPIGLDKAKKVACYLAAPPEDGLLQLEVQTTSALAEKDVTIANDFRPGYAYDVVLCFSDHGMVNSEISIGKWDDAIDIKTDVSAEMYFDLSRYGTANSYVISSSNMGYSFNGTVKGCGNARNGGSIVGVDDCSLPSDIYLDILYCEPEGLLELRNHSLVDGSVLLYVPGYELPAGDPNAQDFRLKTKGNAIIAARRNMGGEILWSWHLWVTDRPVDIGNGNGYSIMDRNLGALIAPTTRNAIAALTPESAEEQQAYGFYYQFGRKDPMIPGWTKPSTSLVSIETAIKNPDTFYGITYPTQGYTWISSSENTDVDKGALWGFRKSRDYLKTIYDPCPPGYRVAELKCWTQATGTTFDDYRDSSIENKYGVFNINGLYAWYPAAGWIDSDDDPQTGSTVAVSHRTGSRFTSADWYTDCFVCTCDVVDFVDDDGIVHPGTARVFNAYQPNEVFRSNGADACPVRCISTSSETIVNDLSKAQTSNCYIIPAAGTYKFKADVKGNATTKVTTSAGTFNVFDSSSDINHDQLHHVAVLWWQGDLSGEHGADSNDAGTKCPVKFVPEDGAVLPRTPARNGSDFTDEDIAIIDSKGYVTFHIDEKTYCHGNAILAAFDSNNRILWTWHMWLTETPKKVKFGPTTSDNRQYTYYCLDRNLGATYSPTEDEINAYSFGSNAAAKRLGTIGFYYQWGRKDPIPGPAAYNASAGLSSSRWYLRNVTGDYSWIAKDEIITGASVATRGDAVAIPTTFLYKGTGAAMNNWNNVDWTQTAVYSQFSAMWGYPAGTTGTTYDPRMTKTINDPCPPGYYMPPHYFFAAAGFAASGQDGDASKTVSYNSHDTSGLFAIPDEFPLSNPMWLPCGGYRGYSNGQFNYLGTEGLYSSGLDMGKTKVRTFRIVAGTTQSYGTYTGGGGQRHLAPGDAANVRCRAY